MISANTFSILEKRRKELNPRQKSLRQALTGDADAAACRQLFLNLHGILHSHDVAPGGPWSYEDLLLADLEDSDRRRVPENEEHSIAWIIWHLSRIEDVTMNMLVADRPQVFEDQGWMSKIHAPIRHTGNAMNQEAVRAFSQALDLRALRDYRVQVGLATRAIVKDLTKDDLSQKVDSDRLDRVLVEGAVHEDAAGIVAYWGRRTIAGLLLMPPTRHAIVHWNEALRLTRKIG
jgi:hypothetical protein